MIRVFIQHEAGSRKRHLYDEKTLEYLGTRLALLPIPYPYGFILDTSSADGDCVDCYVITGDRLISGTIVDCEPIGLLEHNEGEEPDHKVLAALPGQEVKPDQALLDKLRAYIEGVFAQYPEITVHVGRILPKQKALRYLQKHLDTGW